LNSRKGLPLTNPAANVTFGAMNCSQEEKEVIQIGDFAKKAGVSVRAIRYYEELGLIQPESHSVGGFRLYSKENLKRIQVVNCLKELGLSLVEIREIFSAKKRGGGDRESVQFLVKAFSDKLQQVESKIEALSRVKAELSTAVKILRCCEGCDHKVLLDALSCVGCESLTPREGVPDTIEVILN
jgi:DNA-binding transcriptional MerR regulator